MFQWPFTSSIKYVQSEAIKLEIYQNLLNTPPNLIVLLYGSMEHSFVTILSYGAVVYNAVTLVFSTCKTTRFLPLLYNAEVACCG